MIGILLLAALGAGLLAIARRNRIRRRLIALDSASSGDSRWRLRHEREALFGLCIGFLLRGVPGAWLGVVGGMVVGGLRERRSRSTQHHRVDRQVPDLVRSLVATLRVGGDVHGALVNASEELTEPIGPHLRAAVRRLSTGASLDDCLDSLQVDLPTETIERVVEALRTGLDVGGDMEAILRFIGDQVRDRLDIDRQRKAATSQGRMSAIVVGGMPIAFLAMTGSSPSSPFRMLLVEPVGWMMLLVGVLLEGVGFFWVHRVVRS